MTLPNSYNNQQPKTYYQPPLLKRNPNNTSFKNSIPYEPEVLLRLLSNSSSTSRLSETESLYQESNHPSICTENLYKNPNQHKKKHSRNITRPASIRSINATEYLSGLQVENQASRNSTNNNIGTASSNHSSRRLSSVIPSVPTAPKLKGPKLRLSKIIILETPQVSSNYFSKIKTKIPPMLSQTVKVIGLVLHGTGLLILLPITIHFPYKIIKILHTNGGFVKNPLALPLLQKIMTTIVADASLLLASLVLISTGNIFGKTSKRLQNRA